MKVDVNTTNPALKAKLGLGVSQEIKSKLDLALENVIKLNQLRFVGNYARGYIHGKTKDSTVAKPLEQFVDKSVQEVNTQNTATLFANSKPVERKHTKTNDKPYGKDVKSNIRRTR